MTSGLVLVRAKPSAVPEFMAMKHGVTPSKMSQARRATVAVVPPVGTTDDELVTALMLDPNVESASLDYARAPLGYTSTPNDPYATDTAAVTNYPYWRSWWYRESGAPLGTKAARVWPNLTADGEPYHARADSSAFKVAVIDTGFYMDHPDKGSNIVAGKDLCQTISTDAGVITTDYDVTPVPVSTPLSDEFDAGHGTCTAGEIAAATNNGVGVASIGFDTQVRVYKVEGIWIEGDPGLGYPAGSAVMFDSVIINAIDQAVADGCKVISMSLGGPDYDATMQSAIDDARAAGVLVVAASGNQNASSVLYPAGCANVVGVGSYSVSSGVATRSSFSNFGTGLDIMAPGVMIYGLIRPGYNDGGTQPLPGYATWQGTSMATPIVSGAAAMLWRFVPDMTPGEVENLLFATSRDMGASGFDISNGWGAIDIEAAYLRLRADYPALATPTITGAAYSRMSSYQISWAAVSGADHYDVSVDGQTPVSAGAATTFSVLLGSQGSHTIRVRAVSTGRRWSSSVGTTYVTFDSVAPVVSGVAFDPALDQLAFVGEAGASSQVRIDGGTITTVPSSPWSVGVLANGLHTAEVRQIDAAGNVGSWVSVGFTYYATPGQPVLASSYTTTVSPMTLDWPDVPNATSYEVQVGSGPKTTVMTSQAQIEASSTTQTVQVRAVNGPKPGPWTTSQFVLRSALAAPVVSAPSSPSTVFAPWVVVEWAAVPGATGYEYRIGSGSPIAANATSVMASGLAEGANTIQVRALSAAETSPWSEPVAVNYVVPASATSLSIAAPASVTAGRSVGLSGVLSSGGSGVGGMPVMVEALSGAAWSSVGSTVTALDGSWSLGVTQTRTTAYRAVFQGTGTYVASESTTCTVGARAVLSTPYSTVKSPRHASTVTLRTYLTPGHERGAWVRFYLQRLEHGQWHTRRISTATTTPSSSRSLCSAKASFPYTGRWRIVAKYATTTTNLGTTATSSRITVR